MNRDERERKRRKAEAEQKRLELNRGAVRPQLLADIYGETEMTILIRRYDGKEES